MKFTGAQQKAISSKGNTLVIAGAGTGKTRTLVERCVQHLLDPQQNILLDEILMVTFTEAAAAEMRFRIRERLESALKQDSPPPRLHEQLALLDSAYICTLHSFCYQLIREHFYELELDPQLKVLAEEQSKLLAAETLDEMFETHYAGETPEAEAVQRLLQSQTTGGWDVPIRDLILQLHTYTQTRPDPAGWFTAQLKMFLESEPAQWRQWLLEGVRRWRELSLPLLQRQEAGNSHAQQCAKILGQLGKKFSRAEAAAALEAISETDANWPAKQKVRFRDPLKSFFAEVKFLLSLLKVEKTDPLAEDWEWVRHHLITLLLLAQEFEKSFSETKRDSGGVDFHDLEQFALRLLWDAKTQQPTALAEHWREKLKLVFVDEYQDINEAQDRILISLGREGAQANRFLVGDVKQSIYRFRQAAPHIFQEYAVKWRGESSGGQGIYLSDNFRSQESLLNFVNPLFASLMRMELGGVEFDNDARLNFGAPEERQELSTACHPEPRVEVHLRIKEKGDATEGDATLAELSETEKEARLVVTRLVELHSAKHQVWDEKLKLRRAVTWRDMVILLRSPRSKVESYAKEFARAGVALQANRSGFFESIEVRDLLNLLLLLDNPLQDAPTLGVLRSPLVGLSLDELARVRLCARKVRFWTALQRYHETESATRKISGAKAKSPAAETFRKVDTFLERFARWRAMARHSSITQRLEMVLNETSYLDWLLTQPRGEQRQANVHQLIAVARQFDELHRQGLYRFLQFIQAQQEAAGDREPAPLETENAVRLMSIHQSKGLEFPVVVVADLGKRFNLSDTKGVIILDEEYGLCPQIKPPETGQRYPSLPFWLAKQRQRAEALGEELRVLYVALTRAQDTLILTGTCSGKSAGAWPDTGSERPVAHELLDANGYLDWLGPWLARHAGKTNWTECDSGEAELWKWRIHRDAVTTEGTEVPEKASSPPPAEMRSISDDQFADLAERMEWRYMFEEATREPAKASVTALRRKAADEVEDESRTALFNAPPAFVSPARTDTGLDAAAIGIAHHRFLQLVSLEHVQTVESLEEERHRLMIAGVLSKAEAASLNLSVLACFWQSKIGQKILTNGAHLQRELPFTVRVVREDFEEIPFLRTIPEDEFIVVQGVVDLAVVLPQEIWLLDFKTDHCSNAELAEKVKLYAPQLKLYGLALSRIYERPVTRHWLHFLVLGETAALERE